MKTHIISALLLVSCAVPALAQNTNVNALDSTSGSTANANSGSLSGASSDNHNANTQNGNIGVSTNDLTSTSSSGAISGSSSISGSLSDQRQNQGQSQGANNDQSQAQSNDANMGQSQGQTLTANQGQNATNQQGVSVSNQFNTTNRKVNEVRTNNAVPLTSSSSFSSDYCGGSMSAGASGAPIGLSIGVSKPVMDKSCQALRRAEKFGMAAVNAINMNQPELSGRLMSMMIWSICTSDTAGPQAGRSTADACDKLALLGSIGSNGNLAPGQVKPETNPRTSDAHGKPTPEAVTRAASDMAKDATVLAASTPPKP